MSSETDSKKMSLRDIFGYTQETLDEAKKKSNDESGNQVQYLRLSKDSTLSIRVLPLAPIIDKDGQVVPPKRKGYEYPTKELVLKIKTGENKDGKQKPRFVNVCNAKLAYPDLPNDLIDLYVRLVCETYGDDEALCEAIKNTSFSGGLKYDSKRCMYVYDLNKREEGLKILQLSFAQYKELEDRKLELWKELREEDPNATCPICSPQGAYPVKIKGKTENKKTKYSFDINARGKATPLEEDELETLLDAPRLPDVIYVYKRFHLEATIEFLKQYDAEKNINIMDLPSIQDCIDQIKMRLPADDQSHFTLTGKTGTTTTDETVTIDTLWDMWEAIDNAGDDDRSEDGQNLRTALREFIEDKELDVQIGRKKSNYDILKEIEEQLYETAKDDDEEDEKSISKHQAAVDREDEEEEPAEPESDKEEDEEEEEDEKPAPRRSRNDDTNEPAARPARRTARPERRRR